MKPAEVRYSVWGSDRFLGLSDWVKDHTDKPALFLTKEQAESEIVEWQEIYPTSTFTVLEVVK
jgi:hypothetical protein